MAIRTSSQSGNWSATSTWGGAAVPVNGDAVVISGGHDIVFDVDQSAFANGLLSLQIDGILRFKTDIITCLKMNGNITGTGALYVGNSEADPIQRPPSGTESRCQLIFNSTATINVPTIRMYGWYPSKEFTQLDADANAGTNTIVLKEDLGLQQGDIVQISSGVVYGQLTETAKGIYTVQSYNAETKTVVLTSNLQTQRLKNDYISWLSRPIALRRISGTTAYLLSGEYDIKLTGVCIFNGNFSNPVAPSGGIFNIGWVAKHCVCRNGRGLFFHALDVIIEDCITSETGNAGIGHGGAGIVKRCFSIINPIAFGEYECTDCVMVNIRNFGTVKLAKNFKMLNMQYIESFRNITYKNSIIDCDNNWNSFAHTYPAKSYFIRCDISSTSNELSLNGVAIFEDCILPDNISISYNICESFNHNQVIGNYRAWCKGGKIVTENGKLKFICESNDYPVFRDYLILAPSNRTIKFLIGLTKDTANISSKLQIIDPSNDPLIDSTAIPLAESTAQNNINAQQLGVAYKSTTPKQLILRILCQNSSGNVTIDTTRIDQILAKRIN